MMAKAARGCFLTFLLAIIACAPIRAADFELRGTLLCAPGGDRSRLRPIQREVVVVVPDLLPQAASLVRPDGVFAIRLPMTSLDRQLYLRAFNGSQSVGMVPVYLEPGRLRSLGRRGHVYVLTDAFALDRDCDSLASDPSTARATLARLSQELADMSVVAEPESTFQEGQRRPISTGAKVGGVGALLAGVLALLGVPGTNAPPVVPTEDTLTVLYSRDAGLAPGQLSLYARHAASPALGRTLTARRASWQLLSWNPAAIAGEPALGLGAGADASGLLWGAGSAPFSVMGRPSGLGMRILHLGGRREVDLELENAAVERVELDNDETLATLGCGVAVHGGLHLGSSVEYFDQTLQRVEYVVVDTSTGGGSMRSAVRESKQVNLDWDLSLLWDVSPRLRISLAGHNLLDTQGLDANGEPTPLREVTFSGLWSHQRLELGAEVSGSERDFEGAFGLNVRLTNSLGIDVGADSRFDALAAGVDILFRAFRILVRGRRDNQRDFTASCALDWRM